MIRHFARFPVALQAIIINQNAEILLLNSPHRTNGWQTVSGGMEAGETVLDGTLREINEELGTAVVVRPLGTLHVESFHYDQENNRYMLAVYTLFEYIEGEIVPGDDMADSKWRWWSLDDFLAEVPTPHVTAKPWLLHRAVETYPIWRDQPQPPLQPTLEGQTLSDEEFNAILDAGEEADPEDRVDPEIRAKIEAKIAAGRATRRKK